jgi:hypothetical protein
MLMSMQQLASPASAPSSLGFAAVLAEIAAPLKKPLAGNPDGLEDDLARFSYEQALRDHSHSNPQPPPDQGCVPPIRPSVLFYECRWKSRPRRAISVTIRLTGIEAEQLRLRATEAGMTVSAYLRACAFEVESQRVEVKATLAQLSSATNAPKAKPEEPHSGERPAWLRPWSRLFRVKQQA